MWNEQVQDALDQVRHLQRRVLLKQQFHGYSGRVRMGCGLLALLTAGVLSRPAFSEAPPRVHLLGWGILLVVALLLNYAALARWFWLDPLAARDWRRLMPAFEALPPLTVGAVFTVLLVSGGQHDLLFGTWMCLFGLAIIASRHSMPLLTGWVGLFYLFAGVASLFAPGVRFDQPWPMGIVFGAGELIGGLILHLDQTRLRAIGIREDSRGDEIL